ncbi:MAG: hypothetical protein K0S09_1506 [Sphingobacteriaceae bacterium]|nr:hypothetical protein [Sphingobacteriaceae bacterium]
MNYIVAYTPFSEAGEKAAAAAYYIARQVGATLLLINKEDNRLRAKKSLASLTSGRDILLEDVPEDHQFSPAEFVELISSAEYGDDIPVMCINKDGLSDRIGDDKISTREIGLIVSYVNEHNSGSNVEEEEFFRPLLNTGCPILTFDAKHSLDTIHKIGYITDIRYCDMAVLKPLIQLFRPLNAEWIIIHVSASGLPDIENEYAEKLFTNEILPRLNYKKAILINLYGKDIISDLRNVSRVLKPDMIALPSNKYWCYGRLFPDSTEQKPSYSHTPLLFGR